MKRLIRRTASLLALLFVLGFTPFAGAGVIYSQTQPEEPIAAFSSQDLITGPILADNFSLSGSTIQTVRSLRLIGGLTNDIQPVPADMFRIVFLEDANGAPGDVVLGGDFNAGLHPIKSTTGGPLLNGDILPLEYIIDLGAGVMLDPNVDYWIAVMNNPTASVGWAWARTQGVLDNKIALTRTSFVDRSWATIVSGGMYFELSDHNVPEPSSLSLFLWSFITLEFYTRRKE